MKRFTSSPEQLNLNGRCIADFSHPSAAAFSIIGGEVVAWVPRGIHPTIFAALRIVSDPQGCPYAMQRAKLEREGPSVIYRDYGVEFWPRQPITAELDWFQRLNTGEVGALREHTRAGRIWRGVAIEGKATSVLSFWVERGRASQDDQQLVSDAFKLDATVHVEWLDDVIDNSSGSGTIARSDGHGERGA